MDDVSKLQKINSVARELMKHGQASSMDEAVRKATLQVESGSVLVQQQMQEQAPVQMPEQQQEEYTEPEYAPEIRAEQPVERPQPASQSPDVAQKLAEMDNKINRLIAEMTALKDEFRKLKESPVTPPMRQKDAKQGQTQFKQDTAPSQQPKQEEKKSEGHARSGNYKPDDVSIEKFFYYGNK